MSEYNPPVIKLFPNGLRLVSVANTAFHLLQIAFMVGSRHDPACFCGASHLTEHLLCRRCKAIPGRVVDRTYRRYCGGSNGDYMGIQTAHSFTTYGHNDLLRRRDLRATLPVFASLVIDGMFSLRCVEDSDTSTVVEHDLKVERPAVDNETGLNDDDLYMTVYKTALGMLYTTNPARRFGDSDPDQLARVTLLQLKQWAWGWYVPSNMVVVLAGPNQRQATRMVQKVGLDQIPAWPSATWEYDHADDMPVLSGVRSEVIDRRNIGMHHVQLMWPVAPYGSPDQLALQVLADVLKDRIEHRVREENTTCPGGVYHPAARYDCSSSHGLMDVWLATRGDWHHTQDLIQRALAACRHLAEDRSVELEEDVDDAKYYLVSDFLFAYRQDASVLTERMLLAVANGDNDLSEFRSYVKRLQQVTAEDVRRVAAKYLHTDRFVQVIVRPAP